MAKLRNVRDTFPKHKYISAYTRAGSSGTARTIIFTIVNVYQNDICLIFFNDGYAKTWSIGISLTYSSYRITQL